MPSLKNQLPNIITSTRILATVFILFLPVLSPAFFALYILAGFTDVLDGYVARKTNSITRAGAVLDSIADILFYVVMLTVLLPTLYKTLPKIIWYFVSAVILIRLMAYITAAVKYHRFASYHTYLNKLSGVFVFAIPFFILLPIGVAFCWCVCAVTGMASLEELIMHIKEKEYDASKHSLIKLKAAQNKE